MIGTVRTTRAVVHLEALKANLATVRKAAAPGALVCAAVKADAYGHGAIRVSEVLRDDGVEFLGVATPFEGRELREAGDSGRILLLGPSLPDEIPVAIEAELDIMAVSADHLDAIEAAFSAMSRRAPVRVHLKIDTGMGRVGCRPEEAPALARRIVESRGLELAGIATHFPVADSAERTDREFTRRQGETFASAIRAIRADGTAPGLIHAANSGAIALSPEFSFDMVRPGIALYGYGMKAPGLSWAPVMEMRSRISALKKIGPGTSVSYGRTWTAAEDTWIATIPAGYADGYPRLLSNRGRVLIGGRTFPVVGRVCMDQFMVDLGNTTDVALYDEVVLFGPDATGPDAEELAGLIGTISYEITCGISPRVPRIYTK